MLSLSPLAVLLIAAAPPPEEASRLDGIVVTAGRNEQRNTRVAPAVTALDAEQIERQAPQTVAELLRGQVGAYVQQTTPGQGNVIVRGLKGSEVLHLVDGVRLNNAFFRNAPNQYLALVDAQHIERVELVRGPLSTLYGGDAMGGVLQLFTPEPRFAGSDWQSRGRLRLGGGTADDMRLLHARQALGREGLGFSAALTKQEYGERRVGGGERLPFTGFEAEAASLRWLFAPSPVNEWLLGVDLSRQPSTPRHDALVPGFGQRQPESAEFAFEPNQRRLFHLRQRWLASSVLWDSLHWQLARQVVDDDRRSRDFGSSLLNREQNRSTQDSISAQANRSFDDGGELLYGWEWLEDTVRSARQRRDLFNDGPWLPATARYPDGSRMRSAALYGQFGWALSGKTRLTAGLRYSRYRIDLPAADRDVGVDLGFEDVSGSLGLVRQLDRGLSLVANVGRGFRPPNVFDLGTLGARPGNRFNLPNPELGPERLLGADLGLKLQRGRWQGEAFVFRSRYADRITSVLLGQVDDAGRELVQSRNALRMDLSGIEAGLRYRAPEWSLGGSLSFTRGDERLDDMRDPADRIPPLAGRIDFTWSPSGADWDAGLSLRYAERQDRLSPRDVLDPRIAPAGTPGFVVFDAQLTHRLREGLELRLRIDNLGDRRYREHGSGLDEPGRNVVLLLDWRY